MSLSDMTDIPRATVIRKCKYLMSHGYLKLNDKKQYVMTGMNIDKILPLQKKIFRNKFVINPIYIEILIKQTLFIYG